MKEELTNLNSVRKRLDFSYDYKGRRVQKVVYYEDSGNWVKDYEKRFLYDQWNLIAELDENLNLIKTFTWGTDISGTEQGAGGVGGLLSMTVHTTGKTYFYCHDGNGNVVGLVDSSSGTVVQEYEYSPFGELLRGGEDVVNPFKFSGKYTDSESELAYYGFRYHSPELGRWLNRDPIGERGGVNIYGFVGNDGVNAIDVLGLDFIIQNEELISKPMPPTTHRGKSGYYIGGFTKVIQFLATAVCRECYHKTTSCKSCSKETRDGWRIYKGNLVLAVKVFIYTKTPSGGARLPSVIQSTRDHEAIHVDAFRAFHDQVDVTLTFAQLKGPFSSKLSCEIERNAIIKQIYKEYDEVYDNEVNHTASRWKGYAP